MKELIAFDLDGTLAASKQAIGKDMAELLADLLEVANVAVISGGDWPQLRKQVVSHLPRRTDLARLHIMPTTGTKLYRHEGRWKPVYAEVFDPAERDAIVAALDAAVIKAGFASGRTWGEQLEDRGSQITFSALGQKAPIGAKTAWDPDMKKRKALQRILAKQLPNLAIAVGGSTSIDITHKGVDKAYAMRRLSDVLGIPVERTLFLGDAIFPGGNDDPVRAAGLNTIKVRNPEDTATAIRAICACLATPT